MVVQDGEKMKTDCFGYKVRECTALTKMLCKKGECPFYKTKEQFNSDAERAREINEKRKQGALRC